MSEQSHRQAPQRPRATNEAVTAGEQGAGRARIREEFLQDFGNGYQRFGLSKLMGHVVALLLWADEPLSLDEITERLGVSKGPMSQVMTRLRDHYLVELINQPGDRKHYYQASDDIFGQAFANLKENLSRNRDLAAKYQRIKAGREGMLPERFSRRVEEMDAFYELMMEHLSAFLAEWAERRLSMLEQEAAQGATTDPQMPVPPDGRK